MSQTSIELEVKPLSLVRGASVEASNKGHSVIRTPPKIWIDLDNSPHVPFFIPIIDELRKHGYTVVLTARDSYQVCELLKFHGISCTVIGRHWGKNRALKIFGTCYRALRLLPMMIRERPQLAVSHGSRAQQLSSVLLGIPTLLITDYEFVAKLGFLKPDWLLVPHFITKTSSGDAKKQVIKYPGLKEDVYVPRFAPNSSLRSQLGLSAEEIVVTVRPPATEAHYHNVEAEVLFKAALERMVIREDVRVVLLPRNERQAKTIREEWAQQIASKKIVIPEHVVDGLSLIWFSDLVISGGGTMNREAAALGVPVYSVFRGRIGEVDQYLKSAGRLTLIESVDDVTNKIELNRRTLGSREVESDSDALKTIVNVIVAISKKQPVVV
jgi:predicted glycosyltransferase